MLFLIFLSIVLVFFIWIFLRINTRMICVCKKKRIMNLFGIFLEYIVLMVDYGGFWRALSSSMRFIYHKYPIPNRDPLVSQPRTFKNLQSHYSKLALSAMTWKHGIQVSPACYKAQPQSSHISRLFITK